MSKIPLVALRLVSAGIAFAAVVTGGSYRALAWGNGGHEIVALIAQSFLTPQASQQVRTLLDGDTDGVVPNDIASEATWADRVRDENIDGARKRTARWHFVNIEL